MEKKTFNKKTFNKGGKKAFTKKSDNFVPSSPDGRLTCVHDGADGFTNITGMWLAKVQSGEQAGEIYMRGLDKESGTTYQLWINKEDLQDFLKGTITE